MVCESVDVDIKLNFLWWRTIRDGGLPGTTGTDTTPDLWVAIAGSPTDQSNIKIKWRMVPSEGKTG